MSLCCVIFVAAHTEMFVAWTALLTLTAIILTFKLASLASCPQRETGRSNIGFHKLGLIRGSIGLTDGERA